MSADFYIDEDQEEIEIVVTDYTGSKTVKTIQVDAEEFEEDDRGNKKGQIEVLGAKDN